MKHLRVFLLLTAIFMPMMVFSQKQGWDSYSVEAYVRNGQRTSSSSTVWIKFDGNLIFLEFCAGLTPSRYIYKGKTNDGNSIYYLQVYNHGTISQGSGYITFNDNYLLVSPNREKLNAVSKRDNTTTIYKKHNPADVGGMIE